MEGRTPIVAALVGVTLATGAAWAATPGGSGAGCGATRGLVVGMIDVADRDCPLQLGSLTWTQEPASRTGDDRHSTMLFCPLSGRWPTGTAAADATGEGRSPS